MATTQDNSSQGRGFAPLERLIALLAVAVLSLLLASASAAAAETTAYALNASTSASVTGAHVPLQCGPGSFSETGEEPCELAPPGYYVAEEGATAASPCQPGTFSALYGSEECTPAPPGRYVAEEAATTALPCEPGTFAASSESEACTLAPPGRFVDVTGAQSATPCPPGTYSSEPRSTSCETTPPDTYAVGEASEPTPCPPGTEAPSGASVCTAAAVQGEPSGSTGESPPALSGQGTGNGSAGAGTGSSAAEAGKPTAGAGKRRSARLNVLRPHRQLSLARSKAQRVTLQCSVSGVVVVHAHATIVAHHRRVKLAARTLRVRCVAGREMHRSLRFELTKRAHVLLSGRHARVVLNVRGRERLPAGSSKVVRRRMRGRR